MTSAPPLSFASEAGVVEVVGLTKRFGPVHAVTDLSFTVVPGRVTGFLGPNGAGKTTTLRMLLGLATPDAGTATIGGRPYAARTRPASHVGAALEAASFHPGRTARDHLRVYAPQIGVGDARCDEVLGIVGLADAADRRTGGFSMGMRQRLALATTLLGDPQVLLLDEPANGLDPEGIAWLRQFLRYLAGQGRTVLVSSHVLSEVEQTVDDVVIIARGRLVHASSLAQLEALARPAVGPGRRTGLGVERPVRRPDDRGRVRSALPTGGGRGLRTWPAAARARAGGHQPRGPVPAAHGRSGGPAGDATRRRCAAGPARSPGHGPGGGPMIAALRTELRKVSTTRTWWLTALVMFGYMVVMGVIMAFSLVLGMREAEKAGAPPADSSGFGNAVLDEMAIATSVYTLAVALGYIFPAILGALSVTGEFRHRTITPTLLAEPRRSLVLGSKLVAILPFALVVAIAGVVGTLIGGAATLGIMGEPTLLGDRTIQRTLVLSVVALTLWALVGVGFGSVLTNQVAAIVVLLAFTQFVEPLVRLLLAQFEATEAVSKFLPGAAGEAIAGSSLYVSSGLADLLNAWQGTLTLLGYAVILVVIGRVTTFRRDIG
ncbi:MAG: ATP-binding cassette domain-containing protein [Candidatus Nanopelagicales bacterium]|nr:ATP-binding cassette domain-containing protein [Candidatus Nanopelagicales bacterium]